MRGGRASGQEQAGQGQMGLVRVTVGWHNNSLSGDGTVRHRPCLYRKADTGSSVPVTLSGFAGDTG